MKKQFYLIHKWVGIAAFAVILIWSLSGFLHPIMSWTQPRPVQPFLKLAPLESEKLKVSLTEALAKNNIKTFGGFNVVRFNEQTFYQILPENSVVATMQSGGEDCHASVVSDSISVDPSVYLNVETGEKLEKGDEKYAEYLARYFAAEPNAKILSMRVVADFDSEYKAVNRLLPVYEIKFDRADGMKAYVDTATSKLGTLIDTKKSWFQWTFLNLHNLELFGMPEITRKVVITIMMSLAFFTALSGLVVYGLFWRVLGKQKTQTARSLLRKYHRSIGLGVSIFALAWTSSGMFHLLAKQNLSESAKVAFSSSFKSEKIVFSLARILENEPKVISAGLIGFGSKIYYRILKADQNVLYFDAETGEKLENGEVEYAKYLAERFSGFKDPVAVTPISKFEGEYGFILKRLPVMKVQYAENSNERFYVDTSSGKLALKINDGISQWEDISFDYLHKGHFLDWAGKYVRDVFLMLMALGNTIVAVLGIWLFVGLKRRKSTME